MAPTKISFSSSYRQRVLIAFPGSQLLVNLSSSKDSGRLSIEQQKCQHPKVSNNDERDVSVEPLTSSINSNPNHGKPSDDNTSSSHETPKLVTSSEMALNYLQRCALVIITTGFSAFFLSHTHMYNLVPCWMPRPFVPWIKVSLKHLSKNHHRLALSKIWN